MKWAGKAAHYAKAIEAFFGLFIVVGTALLGMGEQIPDSVARWITVIVGVITVIRVWWVKNEPLFRDVIDQTEALAEEVKVAVQPTNDAVSEYLVPQMQILTKEVLDEIEPALQTLNKTVADLHSQLNTPPSGRHSA
jgi:hypothetical protein